MNAKGSMHLVQMKIEGLEFRRNKVINQMCYRAKPGTYEFQRLDEELEEIDQLIKAAFIEMKMIRERALMKEKSQRTLVPYIKKE